MDFGLTPSISCYEQFLFLVQLELGTGTKYCTLDLVTLVVEVVDGARMGEASTTCFKDER